jgi:hypothetical protein
LFVVLNAALPPRLVVPGLVLFVVPGLAVLVPPEDEEPLLKSERRLLRSVSRVEALSDLAADWPGGGPPAPVVPLLPPPNNIIADKTALDGVEVEPLTPLVIAVAVVDVGVAAAESSFWSDCKPTLADRWAA